MTTTVLLDWLLLLPLLVIVSAMALGFVVWLVWIPGHWRETLD